MEIKKLTKIINKFSEERNWEQFHDPKNLAMALSVEVSELVEIFQWLTSDESKNLSSKDLELAKQEIGDIMIYLLRISDRLNINIEKAVIEKIEINKRKYPVELSKDNAVKYNKR